MELIIIALLLFIAAEATYLVAKQSTGRPSSKHTAPVFLDTSVLIDGRILTVAATGFLGGHATIPRSVIGELQFLADNADADKRSRARHGLDVVSELQALPSMTIEILQDGSKAEEGVDERLLNLAKQHNGRICTIDFNLNKVAQVEGIEVLNINELAQSLRMAYLPGERVMLGLTQKGQDAHQAVGHLADGTMVVVEHAVKSVGKTEEVEFIRSLQTAAGKMMFAKLVNKEQPQPQAQGTKKQQIKKPSTGRRQVAQKEQAPAAPITPPRTGRSRSGQKRSPRPKTSADREASFINLVNSQKEDN